MLRQRPVASLRMYTAVRANRVGTGALDATNVFKCQPKRIRDRNEPRIFGWGLTCPILRQIGDKGDMIPQKVDHWTGERHMELPLTMLVPLEW